MAKSKSNQQQLKDMPTRGSKRASTAKPANTRQNTSALSRARERAYEQGRAEIELADRKERNRHKFSTRADVEARARRDQAAGKIPKGQLGKTITRRWKAAQKRRDKFEKGQTEKLKQQLAELKEQLDQASPAELGVQQATVTVTWADSDDTRETTLQFPASSDTLFQDATEALEAYRHSDSVTLISAVPVSWSDL